MDPYEPSRVWFTARSMGTSPGLSFAVVGLWSLFLFLSFTKNMVCVGVSYVFAFAKESCLSNDRKEKQTRLKTEEIDTPTRTSFLFCESSLESC